MGSVAAALGSEIPVAQIEWKGRVYRFSAMSLGIVIGRLEQWLIGREREALEAGWIKLAREGLMSVDEVAKRQSDYVDDAVNGGRYGFGSPRMMKIFEVIEGAKKADQVDPKSVWGLFMLISLLVGVTVDDAVEMFHEKQAEVLDGLRLALAISLPEPVDPKPNGAAASTAR